MSVEVGSLYRSTLTVKDATGTLVDPATHVLTVTDPSLATSTPTVTRDSVGVFHSDVSIALEGLYRLNWVTTGPQTSKTDYTHAAQFRSVVGIDEVKTFIGDSDDTSDDILRQIMMAATSKAEEVVGTCVQRVYTNERIAGYEGRVLRLPHGPLPSDTAVSSIVSVFSTGPTWSTTDFVVYPDSGTVELTSQLAFWGGPWKATYTAGRLVIPEGILLAVKEMIYDLWSIHRSYADDSLEPSPDDTAKWEATVAGYEIPPHAKAYLEPYALPGFA